jgi:hypothetical protein
VEVAVLALVALVSREVANTAGVVFDASSLDWFWQFAPREALQREYWLTLWYLHGQPPLFNALVGAVLQLPDQWHAPVFEWSYRALGVLLAVSIHALQQAFGVPRRMSLVFASLFMLNPSVLLYENWLFYGYPVAASVTASGWLVYRFLSDERVTTGVLLFAGLTALVLTRSLFHVVWLFGVVLLIWVLGRYRGRVVALAIGPLALTMALYAKNVAVAGQFTASTWIGMNLARVITEQVPLADRRALVEIGDLSPAAVIPPFSDLDFYRDVGLVAGPHPSDDALVMRIERKTDGTPNYHHRAYIGVSQRYLEDAVYLAEQQPERLIRSAIYSGLGFLTPSWLAPWIHPSNVASIATWTRVWERVVNMSWSAWVSDDETETGTTAWVLRHVSFGFVAVTILGAVVSGGMALRVWRESGTGGRAVVATTVFLIGTVVYIAVASSLFERGENSRFRFEVEPIMWVVAVAGSWRAAVCAWSRRPTAFAHVGTRLP